MFPGRFAAGVRPRAAKPHRVTEDDVDDALARLERQLDALQAELHAAPARPAEAPPRAASPMEQFGVELRRLSHELVAAYDRVLEHERRRTPRRIALESDADLHALAELERALAHSPNVTDVALRAYAQGRAQLTVEFEPGS